MSKLINALPDGGVRGAQHIVGQISAVPSGRIGLLLAIILFFITFATYAQVVDTGDLKTRNSRKITIYCQPAALPAMPESKLAGIQRAGSGQYAPSGLYHGGGR